MKIKPGTPLHVVLALAPDRRVRVGRLALDRGTAVLQYDPEFIGSAFTLNPFFPTPSAELERAREPRIFDGLHGVIADSLPDAWGDVLVRRRAQAKGVDYSSLTSLDKLAIVGNRGMGALAFEPEFADDARGAIDLDVLAHEAIAIEEGHSSEVFPLLERLGGSSGGARPKVLVAMNDAGIVRPGDGDIPDGFSAWIVKFRSSRYDREDAGPLEAAYADMARAAGLAVSQTKLLSSKTGAGYFSTCRFDRLPGARRLHVASVAGLRDTQWEVPTLDYDALLRITRAITKDQSAVDAMFARMVFNVVAHNRDDHTKQHAFLMSDAGEWTLAPPYDLTFSNGPSGEHYLAVAGRGGDDITTQMLRDLGKEHGTNARDITDTIARVVDAVSRFREFAKAYDASASTLEEVGTVLDRSLERRRYLAS